MKFINDIKENYLEILETHAIEERMDKAKEDIRSILILIIIGIAFFIATSLVIFLYPENHFILKFGYVAIGIVGILFVLIGCYNMLQNFLLLKKIKKGVLNEEIYFEDLYVKNYKSNLKKYNHLRSVNILQYEVLMAESYETAKIVFYYETEENIVKKENVCVTVKRHTKIKDYELHLTETGFVLYAPYKI